ncbi:ABC transporter ATP-binding protein [Denitrobaculum tricleocarpae]|uniref:ABC transporter ATP-binding protein n=1 Tax=Denitrobaculum tricleocarpae TaxID=2591009 RepID=A0A545TKY9_9PROT|nr:ABC transporter ATP-binding protein [Denitrobaculum tricleocarpae]TQV77892.1 ABC transporter ATP-binding protein [Denitrobaculum tricleocarpae]
MSITLSDVTKSFGTEKVLDAVSLEIAAGEFFAVLGPSGCGKTTLLRLAAGLESLDSGSITIGGRPVAGDGLHVAPEDRNVGVVFQSYALWPHMSVEANVGFPLEAAGAGKRAALDQAQRHLSTVELEAFARRKPAELSGGQRQRVALARCLAQGAETILMDEPLANLDPHLRATMEEELARFHRASRTTVLYITHDQREAMALADRLAVMWQGQILQVGAPSEIYRRPASERVARFIGRSAILDGEVLNRNGRDEALIRIGGLEVAATSSAVANVCHNEKKPARILVRPEDVVLDPERAAVTAIAERVAYRGGFWEVAARLEGLETLLALNLPERVSPGDSLPLYLKRAWLLPES